MKRVEDQLVLSFPFPSRPSTAHCCPLPLLSLLACSFRCYRCAGLNGMAREYLRSSFPRLQLLLVADVHGHVLHQRHVSVQLPTAS